MFYRENKPVSYIREYEKIWTVYIIGNFEKQETVYK